MRRALACLAAALLATGCLHARGTAEEPVITAFELEGVRAVDEEPLREVLATQASGRYAWSQAWRLDPDALAADAKRVEAFYRERGWYEARVIATEVRPDGEGRARVVMRVRQGRPTRVAEIRLTGLDDDPEARAAVGRLAFKAGDVFGEAAYDAARAGILAALTSKGYAEAQVVQSAEVDLAEARAVVTYAVTPGPRFRFGRILVSGTITVPREKIAKQVELEVRTGDLYDERKLAHAQARVFELGVFAGVRVSRGTPDRQKGTVPLVVTVREAPFRTVRVGPGLGFESTRWDVQALGSWTHRNWLEDLRKLQFDGAAGYAWIPAPFESVREGPVGKAGVEYGQLSVVRQRVDLSVRVEVERGLEQAYGFWSERLRLSLPVRLMPRVSFVPSYSLEVYQLDGVTGTGPDGTPPQFQSCPGQVCLLSYLEQRLAWDLRDDPVNTREGTYLAISLQEGFNIGGYGYRYLRVLPEARYFTASSHSVVLAARVRAGALIPIKEDEAAPIMARFYSGGALAQRGYNTQRLSPMEQDDTGTWVPVGGNGVLDGSLEARVALRGNLGAVLFVDAGNVALPSGVPTEYQKAFDLTQLQWAAGLGLRYKTPFGPLRFDLGMRLPSNLAPDVPFDERFPAVPQLPGQPEHREPILALHLSLGEAF